MSWKKHFTSFSAGQQSPISGGRRKSGQASTNSRFQSWLPEVYLGQPNRLERYIQYDQMDMDSEVNTAIDTIADFSTQLSEVNDLPFQVMWHEDPTESESEIVQKVLTQWCNINEWNQRIFRTFRNTIKYGDQPFIRDPETWKLHYVNPADLIKVIVDESKGKEPTHYIVKNLDPNFQNFTVTTQGIGNANAPGGISNQLSPNTFNAGINARVPSNTTGGQGLNADIEYTIEAHHVIHLALTDGMDAFWPFGSSVLDPVFKTYKQKELLEDSVIIYRVQRAPERRIFYIDVGDMPPHLAMAHVERVKNEIHQRRIPNRSGGGSAIMDAQYNPLSILEDYFFAVSSEGRGSKVDTLQGGQAVGEIDDLKYFTNKMSRALRVPSSYLPTGNEDGTASLYDGRVGTAYIQEFRFNQYCMRLQKVIQPNLDLEFKMFLKNRGYTIHSGKFDVMFNEPQSFSQYRDIEINSARASLFGQVEGIPYMSKRFAMSKYLGLTDDEILENAKMWKEENPIQDQTQEEDDVSGIEGVGVGGGLEGDLGDFEAEEEGDIDLGDEGLDDPDGLESPISGDEGLGGGDEA